MNVCDYCEISEGGRNCKTCSYGNPCLGCEDYDLEHDTCISKGGCGDHDLDSDY